MSRVSTWLVWEKCPAAMNYLFPFEAMHFYQAMGFKGRDKGLEAILGATLREMMKYNSDFVSSQSDNLV
jgi:hypothetical protein